ncbi:GGDEF domain-containing protein [Vreelandella rituensis]|nr:GGDEF domain-containing protein [Halomonas rituensis]
MQLSKNASKPPSGLLKPKIADKPCFGLMARTAVLSTVMAVVIFAAVLLALSAFAQYRNTVSHLANQQTQGLMTASLLLQQSESLVSSSAMLLLADDHFSRRQAMFEIADREEWIGRLVAELAALRTESGQFEEIYRTRDSLVDNLKTLDNLMRWRIDLRAQFSPSPAGIALLKSVEAQLAEVIQDNRKLSRDLGVAVGYHVAAIRQEIQQSVSNLDSDISQHETLLKVLVLSVVIVVAFTLLFIQRSVIGRVKRLQKAMNSTRPSPEDIVVQGKDEIARMANSIRSYVERINLNEHHILSMNRKLDFLAHHDALTHLHNRHYFERALHEQKASLEAHGYCTAMVDIDHFKEVNDAHGHDVGDKVIQHIARMMQQQLPKTALMARYGGEEFVVIFPNMALEEARCCLEAFRQCVADTPVKVNHSNINVTLSIGLSPQLPDGSIEKTIRVADELLYKAKRSGRNRLEIRDLRHRDKISSEGAS